MQQRSEFRIVYPLLARPVAQLEDRAFSVLDSAEHALRFDQRKQQRRLQNGEHVAGRLELAQGVAHAFAGVVLRADEMSAVVVLEERCRIALKLIYREQRYLRSKFPNWR